MKSKIYLPVVAMFALILFSFTTEKNEGTVKPLANGNYYLESVQLEDEVIYKIDAMTERISISDKLGEEAEALGIWIFRNKTHDDNKFTQYTFIGGKKTEAVLTGEDLAIVEQAKVEIDAMMERYIR